ncbi:MAG TPA: hypothetical protein VMU42_17790, partial [Candidatus Sulfotelmatobacter sp.]|nr:hypothetical protein [Candidatus Sulfotelmatobacter sp.]
CTIADLPDLAMVFAASGTDIHLLAGQLAAGAAGAPTVAIMVEPAETGSRVGAALAGRHFSARAALGGGVIEDAGIDGGRALAVVAVATRAADGSLRPAAAVDAEVEAVATVAATAGRHVLLVAIDVSKTGLIAPSLACTDALQRRFPQTLDVLIDACQFRLAPATLRAYLEKGCMVALTGSKFLTGPAFSGALLIPGMRGARWRAKPLPRGLAAYAAQAEWPRDWAAARTLPQAANFGLLLRWDAALAELQAFRAVPEAEVAAILSRFAAVVTARLADDPQFEPLQIAPLRRWPLTATKSWDDISSIFPFLLRHDGRHAPFSRGETERVYRLLNRDAAGCLGLAAGDPACAVAARRCEVGQPVACGSRGGVPLSALRLCASSRLVVAARHHGVESVIRDALATLDKIALIARHLPTT